MFPQARAAIKYLVLDGRYDYIETGFLISIKENVKNIVIPSEERHISMYPLDFEEFCYALNEEMIIDYIKTCFKERKPLEESLHNKAMLLFKQYMLVGGMPMPVIKYLENDKSFFEADKEKRPIILTTNQPLSKWGDVFGDYTLANAIIDRLVHHSYIIKITGQSYRIKGKLLYDEEGDVGSR